MVNRGAFILKFKEPFVRWVNEVDVVEEGDVVTVDDANDDSTIYLVTDEDAESFDDWLAVNYPVLFENVLMDWYTDESLWPQDRTRELFDRWFDVEIHSVLVDTVDAPLMDDGI